MGGLFDKESWQDDAEWAKGCGGMGNLVSSLGNTFSQMAIALATAGPGESTGESIAKGMAVGSQQMNASFERGRERQSERELLGQYGEMADEYESQGESLLAGYYRKLAEADSLKEAQAIIAINQPLLDIEKEGRSIGRGQLKKIEATAAQSASKNENEALMIGAEGGFDRSLLIGAVQSKSPIDYINERIRRQPGESPQTYNARRAFIEDRFAQAWSLVREGDDGDINITGTLEPVTFSDWVTKDSRFDEEQAGLITQGWAHARDVPLQLRLAEDFAENNPRTASDRIREMADLSRNYSPAAAPASVSAAAPATGGPTSTPNALADVQYPPDSLEAGLRRQLSDMASQPAPPLSQNVDPVAAANNTGDAVTETVNPVAEAAGIPTQSLFDIPEVAGALSVLDPRSYSAVSRMQEADNPLTRGVGNTLSAIGEIPSFNLTDFTTGVGQKIQEGVPRLLGEAKGKAQGLYDSTIGSPYVKGQMELSRRRDERMRQLSIRQGNRGLFAVPQEQRIEDQSWYQQGLQPRGLYGDFPDVFPLGQSPYSTDWTRMFLADPSLNRSLYGR